MNTKLLRRIQRAILAEPLKMDMYSFGLTVKSPESLDHNMPPCGTVACIGGWAVIFSSSRSVKDYQAEAYKLGRDQIPAATAGEALDIGYSARHNLFYVASWPGKFKARLQRCPQGTKRYAQCVAARIEHFIKTKGEE